MTSGLTFQVWVEGDRFGIPVSRPVVAFYYLLEALDFVDYCHKVGSDAVLRAVNGPNWVNISLYPVKREAK
jgi:hypothetical protein